MSSVVFVGPKYRGTWLVGTTYNVNDLVAFTAGGIIGTYIALVGNVGQSPGSGAPYWAIFAQGSLGSGIVNAGSWQAATLINSWSNSGSPYFNAGYRIDAGDGSIVRLRGYITGGASGTNAFVLASGYRPSSVIQLTSAVPTGGTAVLHIDTSGNVQVDYSAAANISLDGVTFSNV